MAYKEEFSGPLPHPRILLQYEQATKGAADRIITMAENQAKHRQTMEAHVIESNIHNEKVGMYLAFILTIFIMLIGAYLLMNNKPIEGYIALFAPGLFQAGNYIYNKYVEKKQGEQLSNAE